MIQDEINRKQSEILEHKSYLNATDYRIARAFETKAEIDPETLTKRAEARDAINRLEEEIKEIEELEILENDNSEQVFPNILD